MEKQWSYSLLAHGIPTRVPHRSHTRRPRTMRRWIPLVAQEGSDDWNPRAGPAKGAPFGALSLACSSRRAGFAGIPAGGLEESFHAVLVPALSRLLAKEDASDATVIGHSAGGMVALALARAAPARVGSVLVVDTIPYQGAATFPNATPTQVAAMIKGLRRQLRRASEANYRSQQTMGLEEQSMATDFHPTLRPWMLASDVDTSATAFVETLGADLRPDLAQAKQPVLVLAPWDADLGVTPEASHEWHLEQYANAPDVDIQVVPDSYSHVMVDQPEAVAAALGKALAR